MAIDQLLSTCVQFRKYGKAPSQLLEDSLQEGHHRQPDWLYSCANIKHTLTTINFSKKLKEFGKFCFSLLQNSTSLDELTKIYAFICKVLYSKVNCASVQSSLTSLFRTEQHFCQIRSWKKHQNRFVFILYFHIVLWHWWIEFVQQIMIHLFCRNSNLRLVTLTIVDLIFFILLKVLSWKLF